MIAISVVTNNLAAMEHALGNLPNPGAKSCAHTWRPALTQLID